MSKRASRFLAAILALGLFGCASTRMTSFVDPAYRGQKFTRLLVVADVPNLETRMTLEHRMVESFRDAGLEAIPASELFPPTREFTGEQMVAILKEHKVEAYISVTPIDAGVQTVSIPVYKQVTKTTATFYGNTASSRSETYNVGGETFDKPWADFNARMLDAETGATIWMASSHTGGNAYATMRTVFGSFCDSVVDRLAEDRLIVKIVGK
jgi:hypothetical protein